MIKNMIFQVTTVNAALILTVSPSSTWPPERCIKEYSKECQVRILNKTLLLNAELFSFVWSKFLRMHVVFALMYQVFSNKCTIIIISLLL